MRLRDFIGICLAFVFDAIQVGTSLLSGLGDQLAVPVQVLYSALCSILLAVIMKPDPRLLPAAILELIPFVNLLPGFTGAALIVGLRKRPQDDMAHEPPEHQVSDTSSTQAVPGFVPSVKTLNATSLFCPNRGVKSSPLITSWRSLSH